MSKSSVDLVRFEHISEEENAMYTVIWEKCDCFENGVFIDGFQVVDWYQLFKYDRDLTFFQIAQLTENEIARLVEDVQLFELGY